MYQLFYIFRASITLIKYISCTNLISSIPGPRLEKIIFVYLKRNLVLTFCIHTDSHTIETSLVRNKKTHMRRFKKSNMHTLSTCLYGFSIKS